MLDIAAHLRTNLGERYEVERELGRGGMAIVFLARDHKFDRPVAIKVLRPELSASLGSERFLREIQIVARLQHPHVLPLYDSGQADGLLYYVMPYVEGESLRDRLKREKQLSLDDAIGISRDVSEALSYAHSHGVVHRDIKPENILLSGDQAIVADFGIARAVSQAGGLSLTDSGLAIGTPPYMSPEQAAGSDELDARSDIYSLGCVLFEMLAGETPFTGPTPQAVVARHISETPPHLHIVRPSVPPAVERAIEKSLEKVPADRFTTALQFSQALTRVSAAMKVQRVKRWVWATAWSGAAVVVLAFVALVVWPGVFRGESLRPGHYVVGSAPSSEETLDTQTPRQIVGAFSDAVRQVPDATLEESTRVNHQFLELGRPQTMADWFRIARVVGAARLVLLSITAVGDSTEVVALEYDVRTEGQIGRAAQMLAAASPDVFARIEDLAEQLFDLPAEALTLPGYGSEDAQAEFYAGMEALEAWDLDGAVTNFRRTLDLDPQHAKAGLWLARVKMWLADPGGEWLAPARLAAESDQLVGDEAQFADALFALASGDFPQACEAYHRIVDQNRSSYYAWYGLGECHRRDRGVLPDPESRSRWAYRSSYHQAVLAYERAFDLVPSTAFAFRREAFSRLQRVLLTQTNDWLMGHAIDPDTGLFASYPGIVADTLAFVPYRVVDMQNATPGTTPPTHREALERNGEVLTRIVSSWHTAFPDSSAPNWALARALELQGELEGPRGSALEAAQRAVRLARTAFDSLNAAVAEIQLLVKSSRFGEAREKADVVLGWWEDPTSEQAYHLTGLAAIIGRPHLAARLSKIGAAQLQDVHGEPIGELALPVLRERQGLMAYAAIGAPIDSIEALHHRTDSLLQAYSTPDESDWYRCRLLWQPLQQAYPVLQGTSDAEACRSTSYLLEMQWAAHRGDTAEVRRWLRELDELRADQRPGEVSIDGSHPEALVALQVGDTAWALEHVDASLSALGTLGPYLLREPPQAAGLVRAMALRADLAAAMGDDRTASFWAAGVLELWHAPETGELQSLVERMGSYTEE